MKLTGTIAKYLCVILFASAVCSCGDPEKPVVPVEKDPVLTVTPTLVEAGIEGLSDGVSVTVTTDAASWKITSESGIDWCRANITVGLAGTYTTKVTVDANEGEARYTVLTVSAVDCQDVKITVTQKGMT